MQITQTISFQHHQENIYPFLQQVAHFLEANLPQANAGLIFKAKIIITELLTNSIKHAGNGTTDIQLDLSPNNFGITKTDSGAPFSVGSEQLQWPSTHPAGTIIKVYTDSLNGLFARLQSADTLTFFTEDYDGGRDEVADLTEHYGLMIICRACDIFTYQYNAATALNTFTAIINL